jgi:uncharacterized membrane protein
VIINYNGIDHITLTLSGSGASWANFVVGQSGPLVSKITVHGYDAVFLLVKVPNNVQTGEYQITITGTNSAEITRSLKYSFNLTN